jgi:adenosylcobyric acid synthase
MSARALMVLGTSSGAGKSLIAAALCRHLARTGLRVAPFKAQNMSLNSAATPDGLEIGRAQALQAEAAGVVPSADHNPVLLKPSANGAQAIVQGRLFGRVSASDDPGANRARFWPYVLESYQRLAAAHDVIVIEGAGSPAEINLRAGDFANMAMAHAADARCLLVGDIDRGGVFAAIFGTLALLDEADRARIDGWIVNKFRGDVEALKPGLAMLEQRIGKPCLGVVPHLGDVRLEEEEGVALEEPRRITRAWNDPSGEDRRLRIAVVHMPHLANFTDFDALAREPSVELRYVRAPGRLAPAHVIVLPGTKDTIGDLRWLRESGLARAIAGLSRDRIVAGICGGMQMLGTRIDDPLGIESGGACEGLGLLDLATTLCARKVTVPARGRVAAPRLCTVSVEPPALCGYEIHAGRTRYGRALEAFATIVRNGETAPRRDGAVAGDGRIIATYLHGIFAGDEFRHAFLRAARLQAGLGPVESYAFAERERVRCLDRLADAVATAIDLSRLPGIREAGRPLGARVTS